MGGSTCRRDFATSPRPSDPSLHKRGTSPPPLRSCDPAGRTATCRFNLERAAENKKKIPEVAEGKLFRRRILFVVFSESLFPAAGWFLHKSSVLI